MKVRDSQEVSRKQVVAAGVAALVVSAAMIAATNGQADATSVKSTPTTSSTSTLVVDRFERAPRHVIVTPITVTKPTVKPHPKPKPKPVVVKKTPVKKVTVKKKTVVIHHVTSSSGKCGASCQWHKTDSVWAKYPAWVQKFALCVSHHESWSPHMWTAENPISTASGGFQWIDGSWRTNMKRAGFSGPGHAAYASPVLQAEVTAWVIVHHGQHNWVGTSCGYGT